MNTTDQEPAKTVTKEDSKAMSDAYNKGTSIDDLAVEYGYSSKEVEAAVVKPVEAPETNGLQSDQSEDDTTKKG